MLNSIPTLARLLFLTLTALLLAGCNENIDGDLSRCTDPFGPPAPVNVTLDSFTVGGDDSPFMDLDNTLIQPFLLAVQPAGENPDDTRDRAQYLADQIGELSRPFFGFEGDDYRNYSSTRNMPDLLEALIASGQINTLNNGRNAMRRCVERNEFGQYNNTSVNLTEAVDDEEEEAEQIRVQVRYTHNNRPLQGTPPNVDRFITLRNLDVSYQAQYDGNTFEGTGINRPFNVRVFFNRDVDSDDPGLTFLKARPNSATPDNDVDIWLWNSPGTPHVITDKDDSDNNVEIRCMIARPDYIEREVEVWALEDSCVLADLEAIDSGEGDFGSYVETIKYVMTQSAKDARQQE